METALLHYFVLDDALYSTNDFNLIFGENEMSIYEIVRVENSIPLFLEAHLRRFYDSARFEGKEIGVTQDEISSRLKGLIKENKLRSGNIRFVYRWSASEDPQFLAWVVPFFYPDKEQYKSGVFVEPMFAERPNPNAKKVLTALRAQADEQIEKLGCFEVIYLNARNEITEGSRSNVFLIQNQQLATPELSGVLPGVTRAVVIKLAQQNRIPVVERKIPLTDLHPFSSCFITGTSPKILPVSRLHEHTFDVENPVMRFFMDAYDELCKSEKENFHW